MKKRAFLTVRTPDEFERWRRLAAEVRQKKENVTSSEATPPTEASKCTLTIS